MNTITKALLGTGLAGVGAVAYGSLVERNAFTLRRSVVPVLPADSSLDGLELSDDATELRLYEHRFPVAEGTAHPGDDPAEVAGRQHYRLAPWPSDATDLNYRRFFAVSGLAGLRIEDPSVLDATHERIFAMVDAGQLQVMEAEQVGQRAVGLGQDAHGRHHGGPVGALAAEFGGDRQREQA